MFHRLKRNPGDNIANLETMYNVLHREFVTPLILKVFPSGIIGGTNSLPKKYMVDLIIKSDIRKGDIAWEIGMGVPYLSIMLGCVTKNNVIGTDIGKKFNLSLYFYYLSLV